MHEVIFQYSNVNNRRALLKNNPIQEQIMKIINDRFWKWVSHPENRKNVRKNRYWVKRVDDKADY